MYVCVYIHVCVCVCVCMCELYMVFCDFSIHFHSNLFFPPVVLFQNNFSFTKEFQR